MWRVEVGLARLADDVHLSSSIMVPAALGRSDILLCRQHLVVAKDVVRMHVSHGKVNRRRRAVHGLSARHCLVQIPIFEASAGSGSQPLLFPAVCTNAFPKRHHLIYRAFN